MDNGHVDALVVDVGDRQYHPANQMSRQRNRHQQHGLAAGGPAVDLYETFDEGHGFVVPKTKLCA